jgi:hypothetical protein
MRSEIIIVRDGQGYRILYGHLRLAGVLSTAGEADLDVKGEGKVKVVKTPAGLIVKSKNRTVPFCYR